MGDTPSSNVLWTCILPVRSPFYQTRNLTESTANFNRTFQANYSQLGDSARNHLADKIWGCLFSSSTNILCPLLTSITYICGNILSPRPFSLCSYVCIGLPRPAHPPKVKYLSLLYVSKQLDRIFHFGRVCWSWKANTCIRAERKRPWRQNISGQYRHTYEQRKRETDGFHAF